MHTRFIVGVTISSLILAGCATTTPVRVNGKVVEKPEEAKGIVTTQWKQSTIASWKIGPSDRVYVCVDLRCAQGAPEELRSALDKLGIKTTTEKSEATYTLNLRGFVTRKVRADDKEIVAPIYAIPLASVESSGSKVEAWIGADNEPHDLQKRAQQAFSLLSTDIRVYDTLWHQTGQLTQTIGGGSPGAYLAGFLLAPILNAIGTAKARSDLKQGLACAEMSFMPTAPAFKTIRVVYGCAASSESEDPARLFQAALNEAVESAKEFMGAAQESAALSSPKGGV